jgi:uncharacterized membrane protein YhaH (DUF805 family)
MSTTTLGTELPDVPVKDRPDRGEEDDNRYRFAAMTVSAIWIALTAASLWSPDLISDADRTHVPIAGFLDWIYAVIATGLVMLAFGRRTRDVGRSSWASFATVISAIWVLVAVASIAAPSLISGTDGTQVPIATLAAPLAGVLATAFASVFVAGSPGERTSGRGR